MPNLVECKQRMAESRGTPDIDWCERISHGRGIPARCPYASLSGCPKYLETISALGGVDWREVAESVGATGAVGDFWPREDHEIAGATGGQNPNCFTNLCPEAAFERFNVFARSVVFFFDSIERDCRVRSRHAEGVLLDDWRWRFDHLDPLHYSECPVFENISLRARGFGSIF